MSLRVRRVVTGHDERGKARVTIDEVTSNIVVRRPGYQSSVIWATDTFPADNTGAEDGSALDVSVNPENGTVFRVIRYEPGVVPRMHRTDSLDYAVVVSGEIDMELDDGESVHLSAGDVVVQRGTIHNWINRGTEACVVAFVLTSAHPALGNKAVG
jgi:quercetin dioxygenase-like cupin family protein